MKKHHILQKHKKTYLNFNKRKNYTLSFDHRNIDIYFFFI